MYNSYIHHRKSIRLKGYDYSQVGLYFITICCQNRICRFGNIKNDEMILNEYGQIAYNEWIKLSERFPQIKLDVFQIMPNHMHGIIVLHDIPVGAGFTPAQIINEPPAQNKMAIPNEIVPQNETDIRATARVSPTVSDIVGSYKSLVANGCLNICKSKNEMMGKLWQRNYYEHIIRDEKSYSCISEYIINNPVKWIGDTFNSINKIK